MFEGNTISKSAKADLSFEGEVLSSLLGPFDSAPFDSVASLMVNRASRAKGEFGMISRGVRTV
ncbi:MAG: hypothetical protein ACYS6I_06760 [Planctomycetota bacterium]|jgi:hypothetical protein